MIWAAETTDNDNANDPGLINVVEGTLGSGAYTDVYAESGDYVTYDKDYANTAVTITTSGETHDTAEITMTDVYPSYAPMITLYAENVGTIPVFMTDFTIEYPVPSTHGTELSGKALDDDGLELIAWELSLIHI